MSERPYQRPNSKGHIVTARLLDMDTSPRGNMDRATLYNRRRRELLTGSPSGPLSFLKCFNRYGYTSFLNVTGQVYQWSVAADVPVDVSKQRAILDQRLFELDWSVEARFWRMGRYCHRLAEISPTRKYNDQTVDFRLIQYNLLPAAHTPYMFSRMPLDAYYYHNPSRNVYND